MEACRSSIVINKQNSITTGSRAFFCGIKDFNPKDTDIIYIVEPQDALFKFVRQISEPGQCAFEIVRRPKQELIEYAVQKAPSMAICRFLTPDFAKEINLTIDDLLALKPMRDSLDKNHKYLGIIYDSYIENGQFYLTNELRLKAYEEYKVARQGDYK